MSQLAVIQHNSFISLPSGSRCLRRMGDSHHSIRRPFFPRCLFSVFHLAAMFARKRPLTRLRDQDPANAQDLSELLSRRRRRSYFPRQPWLRNLWLRLNISKDDPLAWLVFFFVTTLLLAGATLIDGDVFRGSRAGRVGVALTSDGNATTGNGWKSWSPFTSPLEKATEQSTRQATHAAQPIHPKLRPVSPASIPRDKHGLLVLPLDQEKKLREHPIATLIPQAEKKADQLDAKIRGIRKLEDAVADYRDAFGMEPPRGFQKW